MKSVMEAII